VIRTEIDAFNRHDPAGLGAVYTATTNVVDPFYPEALRETDAVIKDYTEFFATFPDARMHLGTIFTNGMSYAFAATVGATHLGPLVGPTGLVPATNRRVTFDLAVFGQLDGQGRIAVEHRHFDVFGLLGQLGLLQ
jgi:hypothetical protein